MQKLKELIDKYLKRLGVIEETYMKDGVFVYDSDVTDEEMAVVEKEYYLLKNIVNSLNDVLKELSKN